MSKLVDEYKPSYICASEDCPNVIHIEVLMNAIVEGKILDKAAQKVIKRFPYFQVSLQIENEQIVHVFDERPIVVRKWSGPAYLGSEETNGHVIMISYDEDRIIFEISHYITDGAGFFPFIKAVLYYYVQEKNNVTLDAKGIYLTDTSLFEDELADAYEDYGFDKDEKPMHEYKRGVCIVPDDMDIQVGQGNTVFYFNVDEKQFMDYCKKNEASPSAAISIMFMFAVRRLCPNDMRDVVCGIGTNQKAVLGNQHSYRLGSSRVYAKYPVRVKDWSLEELTTVTRGCILAQNQPENVMAHEKMMRGMEVKMNEVPTVELRNKLFSITKYKLPVSSTYDVSYVGKLFIDQLEPDVQAIYSEVNFITGNSVLVEVNAVGGQFNIAVMQGFEDDKIVKGFIEELTKAGISTHMVTKKPMQCSTMDVMKIRRKHND